MGRLASNVGAALRSLREQGQRAVLSAVGIAVASLAIVLLVSIARGVQEDLQREIGDIGVNLLIVLPGRIDEDSLFNPGLLGISGLRYEDVERIRRLDGVLRASPMTFVGAGPSWNGQKSSSTLVLAAEPDWFRMRAIDRAEGRFLEQGDDDRRVCVLGEVAKKKLFGDGGAVGSFIEYNGQEYEVVGVSRPRTESPALFSQGGFENAVYLPFALVAGTQPGAQINRIVIQTRPDREPKALVASVERTLGERLEHEAYSVLTQEDLLRLVFKLMGILTWLLVGLTSIALFVGGVGIMTVMLMSVQERTKEIGIRKTVGAKRADIFAQFFTEALLLSLAGGLAGLGVSYGVCYALAKWTLLKPLITAGIVGLAIGVSVGVGAVFGLIPAMRAAARDPVRSLRYE